jgi:hypothetical protein
MLMKAGAVVIACCTAFLTLCGISMWRGVPHGLRKISVRSYYHKIGELEPHTEIHCNRQYPGRS